MEAPVAFVRGKLPAGARRPCLLDVSDLGALRVSSARLHKKAAIALTRWRAWDSGAAIWLAKTMVRVRMFAADKAMDYCDTRIRHEGRLISWKRYSELCDQDQRTERDQHRHAS